MGLDSGVRLDEIPDSNDFLASVDDILLDEEITVPIRKQMIVYGCLNVTGTLSINGTLVVIG